MQHPRIAGLLACILVQAYLMLPSIWAQEASRTVADSAGRRIEIPLRILRVLAEAVPRLEPDLIIDSGSLGATYVSLADTVQAQAKIPYSQSRRFPTAA